ncbi:hypothetical protein BDQ17DRAFT_1335686 [Cyathus striatus]|nr:hypothetical protein BDQ17DRAFT_1335686 [Cyathus striatus]
MPDTMGSIPDPIQTRHGTRIAEQITAAGPPIDAGHPYHPVPPRLQGKMRLAGEQITGAGPPIDPSHLYHPVPPRLHGRTQLVEQGPGLGTSGPPPRQSLSPAPSLITSSTPTHASLPPSPLPGTSAAFFSGNPAQPSEAGVLVRII